MTALIAQLAILSVGILLVCVAVVVGVIAGRTKTETSADYHLKARRHRLAARLSFIGAIVCMTSVIVGNVDLIF